MRARSALFTLFGDVVRPAGGEAWLSVLTACMGALAFTPEATRTALHRMSGEGWVEPRRAGRYAAYRLTERGFARLEEAAARIYRLRATRWDGRWRILVGTGIARDADLVRELTWLGFGRLSADTWVSPREHGRRVMDLLPRHGLTAETSAFVADSADPAQDARIATTAWDLAGLHAAHADFLERWGATSPPADGEAALTLRLELVHHWRSFLFLDPGLPAELLPADWLGDRAADVFAALYEGLAEPSWAFYNALVAQAPAHQHEPAGGAPAPADHRPDASPFAMGLEALATRRN